VVYLASFDIATPGTLGSIELQFCSNDPFIGDPCTAPSGFDALSAQLIAQTGQTGFSLSGNSTSNDTILTRVPAAATAGSVSYTLGHITNPASVGSYYLRILTYASNDGSGTPIDVGGLAFAINNNLSLSAEVPPFLLMCTGVTITGFDCDTAVGDYIDFGNFAADRPSAGVTQIVIATNAQHGYGMWVLGTTLTAGNNTISAMSTTGTSRIGTSQFGLNLAANTTPEVGASVQGPGVGKPTAQYSQANHFRFVSGEQIASAPSADDYRKYTVSYLVNVAKAQPPGVYSNTLTYLTTGTF